MKVVILSFTKAGTRWNQRIGSQFRNEGTTCQMYAPVRYTFAEVLPLPENPGDLIREGWGETSFLFIGAVGIAVRYIAPYVKDKFTDSAVVVMDEKAEYVIPVLSGHLGGAVELARHLADWTGAIPVQTTATDVQGKFAVDVFAKKNHLVIKDREAAKKISAAVLDHRQVGLWIGEGIAFDEKKIPKELMLCRSKEELLSYAMSQPAVIITKTAQEGKELCEALSESVWMDIQKERKSDSRENETAGVLCLYPRNIMAGVGCRRQIPEALFESGLNAVLEGYGLEPGQMKRLASIDLKKEEPAILAYAKKYQIVFETYPAEQLKEITEVTSSSTFVKKVTGVDNVCERSAKIAEPQGYLLCPKCVKEQMTVALVETEVRLEF